MESLGCGGREFEEIMAQFTPDLENNPKIIWLMKMSAVSRMQFCMAHFKVCLWIDKFMKQSRTILSMELSYCFAAWKFSEIGAQRWLILKIQKLYSGRQSIHVARAYINLRRETYILSPNVNSWIYPPILIFQKVNRPCLPVTLNKYATNDT